MICLDRLLGFAEKLVGALCQFVRAQYGSGAAQGRGPGAWKLSWMVCLFMAAQVVVDTTLVFALKVNGEPRRGAADRDGVAPS